MHDEAGIGQSAFRLKKLAYWGNAVLSQPRRSVLNAVVVSRISRISYNHWQIQGDSAGVT